MQQFEEAQQAEVVSQLSERNVVEIVMELVAKGKLRVIRYGFHTENNLLETRPRRMVSYFNSLSQHAARYS